MQTLLLIEATATTSSQSFVEFSFNDKKCRDMPKVTKMNLIQCCSLPEIFSSELKEKCVSDCSDPNYSSNPWCCMTTCLMEESTIGTNGTIDKGKIIALFKALFLNVNNQKIAETAVEKCYDKSTTTTDPQTEECDFPKYATILSCITNEIFYACPYTVNNTICIQIKNFLRNCPSKRNDLFNVQ
ncbi:hypothetical protein PVAND_009150 [Polypedilum vanderplanki]|uniref:Odorant binding protein n=1 Tax=Polypedilum vanderplanki TaxID=319348 RepID=A0A9J6CD82_POLVA|nr:hypothetical protein PVAND_009150 [Polypedilum vanderplanki]